MTTTTLLGLINSADLVKINGEPSYGICIDKLDDSFDLFWTTDGVDGDEHGQLFCNSVLNDTETAGNEITIGRDYETLKIEFFDIIPKAIKHVIACVNDNGKHVSYYRFKEPSSDGTYEPVIFPSCSVARLEVGNLKESLENAFRNGHIDIGDGETIQEVPLHEVIPEILNRQSRDC